MADMEDFEIDRTTGEEADLGRHQGMEHPAAEVGPVLGLGGGYRRDRDAQAAGHLLQSGREVGRVALTFHEDGASLEFPTGGPERLLGQPHRDAARQELGQGDATGVGRTGRGGSTVFRTSSAGDF